MAGYRVRVKVTRVMVRFLGPELVIGFRIRVGLVLSSKWGRCLGRGFPMSYIDASIPVVYPAVPVFFGCIRPPFIVHNVPLGPSFEASFTARELTELV